MLLPHPRTDLFLVLMAATTINKLSKEDKELADVFFTVRWTASRIRRGPVLIVKDVTDEHASTENEQDRVHVNEFLKLVKEKGGHFDPSLIKFVCIKRFHPCDDSKYVRICALSP